MDQEPESTATEVGCSRDFLRSFGAAANGRDDQLAESAAAAGGDVELSLGLSLNGCFSANKKPKLSRSSSVSSLWPAPPVASDRVAPQAFTPLPLARASSLPSQAEAERQRRREEMENQIKRIAARRRRLERRNSMNSVKRGGEHDEVDSGNRMSNVSYGGVDGVVLQRSGGGELVPDKFPQGSCGSQGSSSSRGSPDGHLTQAADPFAAGPSGSVRMCSPATNQSMDSFSSKLAASISLPAPGRIGTCAFKTEEDALRHPPFRTRSGTSNGMLAENEMPSVSTTGEGPNGRRIEGFLYKYKKGEEVRIVCVCHGSFLTPAEFVRHAGGGNVANPLKHILVTAPPSARPL